ncbi:hypothetical protein [Streptomyces venezuelae]|uniref:Uncharacterized protein n=5 Tax=Streptomyces TaxID=1883 RepID=A0A5P2BA75_STRVZ|nr:hypothetical protein [Streptomyces venezuelae]QES26101.1 hypothetical protein DEJ47_06160 [Streptomyces venezuelae]
MIAETVCSAVSAAGLGIAAVMAYRKRFLSAARLAGYALVPIGLVLTGVVGWAADTAFSLKAWVGFGLLGAAWLVFLGTRAVERRTGGTRKERKAAKAAQREAVAPAASAPSLGGGRQGTARPAAKPQSAAPAEDFSDIEAILKKHGI